LGSEHGECLVTARFEGDSLALVVEGSSSGSQDRQLLQVLHGEVPDGTPIVVKLRPAPGQTSAKAEDDSVYIRARGFRRGATVVITPAG
jgi:hypothetical protein